MTDNPFDYELPIKSYEPVFEEVTRTRPTGEQYNESVVVAYKFDADPPLTGTNLEQLRYAAAKIEVRTGLKVRVAPRAAKIKIGVNDHGEDNLVDAEHYEVLTAHATGGPALYEVMWAWLSGFESGNAETMRQWK
jgi:hypothetical protein